LSPAPQLFQEPWHSRDVHYPGGAAPPNNWDTSGETLMLKSLLGAAAAVSLLGVVACSQGTNEEAGETADTAYEQSTTGTTDLSQGPAEEAGEAADQAAGEATEGTATTPPPASTTP
jgi:hypothetical protein